MALSFLAKHVLHSQHGERLINDFCNNNSMTLPISVSTYLWEVSPRATSALDFLSLMCSCNCVSYWGVGYKVFEGWVLIVAVSSFVGFGEHYIY